MSLGLLGKLDAGIHKLVSTSPTAAPWPDWLRASISSDFRTGRNKAAPQLSQQGLAAYMATNQR